MEVAPQTVQMIIGVVMSVVSLALHLWSQHSRGNRE